MTENRPASAPCACKETNPQPALACKLTPPEFQKRKETMLASLKRQVLERKELPDGYSFRFPGTDQVLDELIEFIKTERTCCEFFHFTLSVNSDKQAVWLTLTGTEGVKAFITTELDWGEA